MYEVGSRGYDWVVWCGVLLGGCAKRRGGRRLEVIKENGKGLSGEVMSDCTVGVLFFVLSCESRESEA